MLRSVVDFPSSPPRVVNITARAQAPTTEFQRRCMMVVLKTSIQNPGSCKGKAWLTEIHTAAKVDALLGRGKEIL